MRLIRALAFFAALAAVLVASAAALDIEPYPPPPPGLVGVPYSYQFTATGGWPPYKFTKQVGEFPPGLTLTDSGLISGTPTQSGEFSFWMDVGGQDTQHSQDLFTIKILEKLDVATASLPTATVGAPYSVKLAATITGTLKWSLSAGSLPGGLSFSPDGTISGAPTAAGAFTFTVLVRDEGNPRQGTKQFTLNVVTPLAASTGTVPAAEVGRPFRLELAATGGLAPLTWTTGSLPSGLVLDPASGVISGMPSIAGSSSLTLIVTDADGRTATTNVMIAVAAKLTLLTKRVAAGQVGESYKVALKTKGGIKPLRWKQIGGAVPGLRLDTRTGVLRGTAKRAGTYRLTIRVTDALGAMVTKKLTLVVRS